jgi:hypothetical protein
MAVIVKSAAPKALLAAIKKAIDDKRVDTWSYDDQGDFTQAADQWKTLAWLRPELARESLTFGIIPHRERALTHAIYAAYHARMIEMLLTHFSDRFAEARASADYRVPPDILPRAQ